MVTRGCLEERGRKGRGGKEGREVTFESFKSRYQPRARHDTERPSSDELHVGIGDLDVVSSMPVFRNDLDDGERIR